MSKCQFHKWIQVSRIITTEWVEVVDQCVKCLRERKRMEKPRKAYKPKKRGPLASLSAKHREWVRQYNEAKKNDAPIQACRNCGRMFDRSQLDPHHIKGRKRGHIMEYLWVCRSLHVLIHARGTLARQAGWLQPQYDQPQSTEEGPKPWLNQSDRMKAIELGFICQ